MQADTRPPPPRCLKQESGNLDKGTCRLNGFSLGKSQGLDCFLNIQEEQDSGEKTLSAAEQDAQMVREPLSLAKCLL